MRNTILTGHVLDRLRDISDGAIDCCVTSPPYWGLRDYGHDGQIGLEPTPEEYVARMVAVFREVRRVLRDDGTLWLNLGDSYVGSAESGAAGKETAYLGRPSLPTKKAGLAPKNLVGIPWRVAFALQADGWYLRSDIIWHKPNPMPESVTDRPTKAHEYVFLLSKSARYYYDHEAIKEKGNSQPTVRDKDAEGYTANYPKGNRFSAGLRQYGVAGQRNARSVWTVATQPYPEAHFAVYPPALPERCILAGCPEGGIVLDPFFGSGTTGYAARKNRRDFVGIELNPEYVALAEKRLGMRLPLFSSSQDAPP